MVATGLNTAVFGLSSSHTPAAHPQPHGQGDSSTTLQQTRHPPSCPRAHQMVPPRKAQPAPSLARNTTQPGDTCRVPAHLRLPLAPTDPATVHGASVPWLPGAVPCRWVDSVGCPAGGPRAQGTGREQHVTESPGPSPPRSQGKRMRKEKGWR